MVTDPGAIRHPPAPAVSEKKRAGAAGSGLSARPGPGIFRARIYLLALPGAPGPRGLLDLDRSMRNLGRILSIAVLGLAGCSDVTFPLLPEDGGAPMAGGAGAGAGLGATAGMPTRGGAGGRGAAGSAGMAQGGMGNGPECPPSGCDPQHCT